MNITIMNKPDIQQNKIAWLNSRPSENPNIELGDILGLDLPVNEFATVNLFIESTILEREIIATMRNHVMWAQTSRVQNVLEFEMPEWIQEKKYYEDVRKDMEDAAKSSRQDEYRLMLPVLSKTKYSISISLRGLVKLYLYFNYLSKRAQNSIFFEQCLMMSMELENILFELGVPAKTGKYKYPKILNEAKIKTSSFSSTSQSDIITTTNILPIHLRAQLVRHRNIGIVDNLFDLANSGDLETADLRYPITVTAYGHKDNFKEVLSKRTCWVAHYKIWGEFLYNIERHMDDASHLPCVNGECPFSADAKLRYEHKDPNPPCPIHLRLNGLEPSVEDIEDMRHMVRDDLRPIDVWEPEIQKLEIEKS